MFKRNWEKSSSKEVRTIFFLELLSSQCRMAFPFYSDDSNSLRLFTTFTVASAEASKSSTVYSSVSGSAFQSFVFAQYNLPVVFDAESHFPAYLLTAKIYHRAFCQFFVHFPTHYMNRTVIRFLLSSYRFDKDVSFFTFRILFHPLFISRICVFEKFDFCMMRQKSVISLRIIFF